MTHKTSASMRRTLRGLTAATCFGAFIIPRAASAQVLPAPAAAGRIAFVSDRDGNREIYVMNADGSDQTRLTHSAADDGSPCFSPDGRKIAFRSAFETHAQICVMNADGSDQVRLTNGPDYHSRPVFSPDGRKIAFHSFYLEQDSVTHADIYVMNADGSDQVRLTHNTRESSRMSLGASWSPDGNKIAFEYDDVKEQLDDIYVMDADGSNVSRLTYNQNLPTTGGFTARATVFNRAPSWSPDGSKIIFNHGEYLYGETGVSVTEKCGIYMMNADGSNQTPLTSGVEVGLSARFSLDGSKIVYSSEGTTAQQGDGRDAFFNERLKIFVMNADGTGRTQLTHNSATECFPSWGPAVSTTKPDSSSG